MRCPTFLFKFFTGISNAISATGITGIGQRLYRTITKCHPNANHPKYIDCNNTIQYAVMNASIALSWFDYLIRWIPILLPSLKKKKILLSWNILSDIISMWNFCLYTIYSSYIDFIIGKKSVDDIEDDINLQRLLPMIIVALSLAILSNTRVRDRIACIDKHSYRGLSIKTIDGLFETIRGFATGRGFVHSIEMLADAYLQTTWNESHAGMIARNIGGTFWSIFNAYASILHTPHYETTELFPHRIRPTISKGIIAYNVLFSSFIFSTSTLRTLKTMNKESMIQYGAGFCILIPLIATRSIFAAQHSDSRAQFIENEIEMREETKALSSLEPSEHYINNRYSSWHPTHTLNDNAETTYYQSDNRFLSLAVKK